MRYATYSRRARALFVDSIWWTVILLLIPLGPSTENILTTPEVFASSVILWLMVGQCIPILVTGVMWAAWGTSPEKRALHLRIVDANTGQPMTVRQVILHFRLFAHFRNLRGRLFVGPAQPAEASSA